MTDKFDPTTNRVPFELLTDEEKKILMNWPHGFEVYNICVGWSGVKNPCWVGSVIYRGKPAPKVTSKWFNVYSDGHTTLPHDSFYLANIHKKADRIAVLRIDTCDGVSTAHLEEL
jgi:hypothetical protein